MPRYFDRRLIEELAGPFTEWPLLLCPVCHATCLESEIETVGSLLVYDADETEDEGQIASDWEVNPLNGLFHGTLSCPRAQCRNKYVVTGMWELTNPIESAEDLRMKQLYVRYVLPAFPIMELPEDVPDKVRDLLANASLVLLSDPSAAANRIRAAIEALLDTQRVRRFPGRSRTNRLTTHARIIDYGARNPQASKHLMAMKWIGNMGSHEREPLTLSVVLDGIEHFARAIEFIYDSRERALDRRADFINLKRGKFKPSDLGGR